MSLRSDPIVWCTRNGETIFNDNEFLKKFSVSILLSRLWAFLAPSSLSYVSLDVSFS